MQIGNPTDVKHVAHIGSDGPAANPPAWMNEYRSEANVEPTRKHSSQGIACMDILIYRWGGDLVG